MRQSYCIGFSFQIQIKKIILVDNLVKVPHDGCRSVKKRVGEYQKLTGSLPGIWRLAQESSERATKAESSLKEAQVSLHINRLLLLHFIRNSI